MAVPGHRIVFGPFQPTLEDRLVEACRALRQADPLGTAILLVGSNYLATHLIRLLARRLGAAFGIRTVTFLDLARLLARDDLERDRLRPLTETGARLVLRSLAAALPDDSYFAGVRQTRGFDEALLATLRDLGEAGVSPDELRAAWPRRERKYADLAGLDEGYRKRLAAARLIDRPGILARAAAPPRAAREDAGRPPMAAAALLVYGFYDFTGLQERFLVRLAGALPTTVFFPWRDTEAFEYAARARRRLLDLGFAAGAAGPDSEEDGRRPAATPALLDRVQTRLFTLPDAAAAAPGPAPPGGAAASETDASVRVLAVPGEPREAAEAARAVLDLARDGFRFEEIGVLHRGDVSFQEHAAAALERLSVPVYRTAATPLAASVPARAVRLLLDIKESDFEREQVVDFFDLCDPEARVFAVAGGEAGESPASPADWDLLSRQAGITSGATAWRRRLEDLRSRLRRAAAASSNPEDERAGPDPRLVFEAGRLSRVVARLASSLEAVPLEGRWTAIAAGLSAAVSRFLADRPERQAVLEVLEDLADLEAIEPTATLRDVRRLLDAAFESGPSAPARRSGRVFVGDVLSARGLSFRAVVLCGMVEQSFPPPPRQDPILLDDERARLNAGGAVLPIRSRRLLEERLLFALTVNAARERLVLTYPRLDETSGRDRLPSPYLMRVVEAADGSPCDYARLARWSGLERLSIADLAPDDPRRIVDGREFDLAVAAEAALRRSPSLAIVPAAVPGAAPFFRRGLRFEARRWGARRFTEMDGRTASPEARAVLRDRHGLAAGPLSPTRLGQYMLCPYQYFGTRILGLEPLLRPESQDRIEPRDRGTLLHGILQEFFADLRAAGRLPLKRAEAAALHAALTMIARRHFDDFEKRGLLGLPLFARLERAAIERDLGRVLEDEIEASGSAADAFVPAHFEVRFGMPPSSRAGAEDPLSTDAPVVLPLEDGPPLRFKGQIDRIDVAPGRSEARVIDYKSGRLTAYSADSHQGGTALQLPVYILAAEALLPGTSVRQALYRSVTRLGGFDEVGFGRDGWEATLRDLRAVGALAVDGVAGGLFFHYPTEAACRNCDVLPLCGEARDARFERKRGDPAAAPFLEFKDRTDGEA